MRKKKIDLFIHVFLNKSTIIIAIKVAIIVGTILNFINQGGALVNLEFNNISLPKLLLTFMVPYLVSSYSTALAIMQFGIGEKSPINTKLKCSTCNSNETIVRKKDIIPICASCKENTHWKLIV